MDRISNLPDEIIGHIGSFFSAKEAAFTALLSKRWHNLYENLFHLSIPAQQSICWIGSQVLLNKYPNLKTITIKGSLHYKDDDRGNVESVCECLEGYSFLSSCSIEVLKITECKGDIGEMVQIKHMLEKLPSLEILVVHLKPRRVDTKLQITVDLLMLPRYSSKCKIWVKHSLTKSSRI